MTTTTPDTYAWRSKVRTPAGRLRELVRTCDPHGAEPNIKLHLNEDAGPFGAVRGYCHSTYPNAWHVSLVGRRWEHAGKTTGEVLMSGNRYALETLVHELVHFFDLAYPVGMAAGTLPDPAKDFAGWLDWIHRSAFQRVNDLFRARCLVAGLLANVYKPSPREEAPTPAPQADGSNPYPSYPEPAGLWPEAGVDLAVFAGLSGVETFRIADTYASGFPPAPEGWTPECGTAYGWPGSLYQWRVHRVDGDTAWCDRLPAGMGAALPLYVLSAMKVRP